MKRSSYLPKANRLNPWYIVLGVILIGGGIYARSAWVGTTPLPLTPPPESFLYTKDTPNYKAYAGKKDTRFGYGIMLSLGEKAVSFDDIHASRIDPHWEDGSPTEATASMKEMSNGERMLRYEQIFPHTDIQYRLTPAGMSQEIIITEAGSVVDRYAVRFGVNQVSPKVREEHVWHFLRTDNTPVFRIAKGYVTDAKGTFNNDVKTTILGSTIVWEVPHAWMRDATRAFPVIVHTALEVVPELRKVNP